MCVDHFRERVDTSSLEQRSQSVSDGDSPSPRTRQAPSVIFARWLMSNCTVIIAHDNVSFLFLRFRLKSTTNRAQAPPFFPAGRRGLNGGVNMGDFLGNGPVGDQPIASSMMLMRAVEAGLQQKQACFSQVEHVNLLVLSGPDYGP